MSLILSDSGQERHLPEIGSHVARCVVVIDKGTQQTNFGSKKVVLIGWELPNEPTYEWEDEERACMVWQSYTANLGPKSNLRKMLESWRGRKYTTEELQKFDLSKIVGKPCMLGIMHSADGQYANISSVSSIPKGTECPPQITPSVVFDLAHPDLTVLEAFSDKLKASIKDTPEYAEAMGHPNETADVNDQHIDDDDIPF